jgi:hypothetical protein
VGKLGREWVLWKQGLVEEMMGREEKPMGLKWDVEWMKWEYVEIWILGNGIWTRNGVSFDVIF